MRSRRSTIRRIKPGLVGHVRFLKGEGGLRPGAGKSAELLLLNFGSRPEALIGDMR
jgi:hypothetical protein